MTRAGWALALCGPDFLAFAGLSLFALLMGWAK